MPKRCSRCKAPAAPGRSKCRPHLKRDAKSVAKVYAKRIRAGVCRQCGGPLSERSILYCPEHLEAMEASSTRSEAKKRAGAVTPEGSP